MHTPNTTRLRNTILLFLAIALTFVVAEITIRVAGFTDPVVSGWSWENSPRRDKHVASGKLIAVNQLGYRGQSILYDDEDYVIVLLGDSQVEAVGIDHDHMPERLLQNNLEMELDNPVKVFSIASSGWGQDQQLLALKRYFLTYRANLVLLWATPANDFWENAFPDRSTGVAAGHLKPTFRLVGDQIKGPFYESSFYYWNSAVLNIVANTIANIRGEYIEQWILRDWMDDMPANHTTNHTEYEECVGLEVITQSEYQKSRYLLKEDLEYIVETNEDFINSRSHFSPYAQDRSARDNYLIRITQKLIEEIETAASGSGSEFLVFFPERENVGSIKCIKQHDSHAVGIPIKLDHAEILRSVVSDNHLVLFDLQGGNELSLSNTDHHLSILGNMKAMHSLATLIGRYLVKN